MNIENKDIEDYLNYKYKNLDTEIWKDERNADYLLIKEFLLFKENRNNFDMIFWLDEWDAFIQF